MFEQREVRVSSGGRVWYPLGEADVEWFMEAPDERVVRVLRREVLAYLARHAEPGSALEDAEMIVAELVANAVRHGRGPIWVSLDWSAEEPVLTVRDVGHGFTMPDRFFLPPATSPGGRGLYIVSQLARSPLVQLPPRYSAVSGALSQGRLSGLP